jgi:muconate cycloisomerase
VSAGPLLIGDVRLIVADIPVSRPHHMSFTTLTAVNFVFVRIETRDGVIGWGEAACLGGPTWSEESAESISATLERYVLPWLVGRDAAQLETLRLEMGKRVQGNPFARAAVEMALWDLNGRALGVPVHRLLGGRVRDRVPLSWSLAVSNPDAELAEAREKVDKGHRIFKIKTAAHPVAEDVARVRAIREAVGPDVRLRVDANQGWDRPTALRAIRAMEPYDLDFVEQPVRLAAGRTGHRPARRRVDPGAQAHQVRRAGAHHGHRPHRRGRRPRLLHRLHDRDLARHRRVLAGRAGGAAGDVGL